MKKKNIAILSSILLSTTFFTTSQVSASTNSEEFATFSYEEFANNHSIIKETIKETESKEYLTDEVVNKTTPDILSTVYNQIKDDPDFNTYTADEKDKKYVANLIKEAINKSDSEIKPRWSLPGYNNLTNAEKEIAKNHPIEFTKYADAALVASNEAQEHYGESQLYKGNGDAFRHAYWNAIIIKRFNGPLLDRLERTKAWTDAHESESSGIDKEMDLMNNYFGRENAHMSFPYSNSEISSQFRDKVAQGSFVRIVDGELIATSRWTGK